MDSGLKGESSPRTNRRSCHPPACTWLRVVGTDLHAGCSAGLPSPSNTGHFLPAVEMVLAGLDFRGTRVAPINQLLNNLVNIQNTTHQAVHLLVEVFKPA